MPNPFAKSRWYHKLSNIFVAPGFRLLPMPRGFVLLTVTGRRTGLTRRRPVRAVRRDNTFYAVAVLGERSDWLRNVRANPTMGLKVGGRTHEGQAREVADAGEREEAGRLYAEQVFPYDYIDYPTVHWAWPGRRAIVKAHRQWLRNGVLVAIDLTGDGDEA